MGQKWRIYGISDKYEVPIKSVKRIVDLLAIFPHGHRVAHEVQLASITTEHLEARTNDYARAGLDVVWWLGKSANTPANREWCLRTFGRLVPGKFIYPYRGLTFESFVRHRQPQAFKLAKAFAQKNVKADENDPTGILLFYGSYGTGKTHLSAAICNYLLDCDMPCRFVTARDLFEHIQRRMNSNQEYDDLLDDAIDTPLLALDDIDKVKPSEWKEELFFSIIDKRVMTKRSLVISTNRLDELDRFVGGAAADRLKARRVAVEMAGESYRSLL